MLTNLSRRSSTRVVATAGLCLALTATLAPAATAAPSPTQGLFGSSDATYDGAYRQSMAILGLVAAKSKVPASSVTWLVAQQCADGSFQAFRSDLSAPCAVPDPEAFSGPDSNSTALAAMALKAAGRAAQAKRAAAALRTAQNSDGGWGYTLGSASDVNSTGIALSALKAFPATKEANGPITRATSYLKRAQLPCSAPAATRFAMPYQPGQAANSLASVQALLGLAGTLPTSPIAASSVRGTTCGDPLIQTLAWHVNRVLATTKGRIPSPLDSSTTDWNATATGVMALASAGAAPSGIRVGIRALGRNTVAFVGSGSTASPAATGTLIQAAVAAGRNPRSFGTTGTNLVSLLLGTLQK